MNVVWATMYFPDHSSDFMQNSIQNSFGWPTITRKTVYFGYYRIPVHSVETDIGYTFKSI